MLKLIDRLAGWWLDWRTDKEAAKNPVIGEFGLKKIDFDEHGFNLIASFPGVVMLADEAANMLQANHAKNYVQFDMMPRLDRGLKPIRVTIQWACGESPASKAARLEKEIEALKSNHAANQHLHRTAQPGVLLE